MSQPKAFAKTQRKRLRQLLTADYVERLRRIKLIDDILACTERVLNPAAHSGTTPFYGKEIVQDAPWLWSKNVERSSPTL